MKELVNYNLIFAENQRIETERLILRPVTLADAEDFFEFAGDEETTRFVYPTHQTVQDTRIIIANLPMKAPYGKNAIELKAEKKMIGTVDLRVDEEHEVGELGYVLSRYYWHQGYMTEACEALLQLGFEEMKLIRIFASHDERNSASGRVMKNIGMTQEGLVKNSRRAKGQMINSVYCGITFEDWQKRQRGKY